MINDRIRLIGCSAILLTFFVSVLFNEDFFAAIGGIIVALTIWYGRDEIVSVYQAKKKSNITEAEISETLTSFLKIKLGQRLPEPSTEIEKSTARLRRDIHTAILGTLCNGFSDTLGDLANFVRDLFC